jgi:ribosomal-protein-alanine N-acetyltransferase
VALERASSRDLERLGALASSGGSVASHRGWQGDLAAGRLWLLRGPGGIVAWCSVRWVADEVHLEDLEVAPEARRRGWGRRLLGLVLRLGRERGAAAAHLEVRSSNAVARGLYRAAGFVEVGRRRDYYAAPREDAVSMRRALGAESSLEIAQGAC